LVSKTRSTSARGCSAGARATWLVADGTHCLPVWAVQRRSSCRSGSREPGALFSAVRHAHAHHLRLSMSFLTLCRRSMLSTGMHHQGSLMPSQMHVSRRTGCMQRLYSLIFEPSNRQGLLLAYAFYDALHCCWWAISADLAPNASILSVSRHLLHHLNIACN
jgi:hypothetical protein